MTTMYEMCMNCYELTSIAYPSIMDACLTWYGAHISNKLLTSFTGPTSMNACTTMGQCFQTSTSILSIVLPASMNALLDMSAVFFSCNAMVSVTPPLNLPVVTNISSFCGSPLLTYCGPITFGTQQVAAGSFLSPRLMATISFPTLRVSQFTLSGGPLAGNLVTSVNIDWANSTYGGTGSQIILNYLNLSAAEINRIFTALPTVTGKTIGVNLCTGSATCTPAIATAKGWTVVK